MPLVRIPLLNNPILGIYIVDMLQLIRKRSTAPNGGVSLVNYKNHMMLPTILHGHTKRRIYTFWKYSLATDPLMKKFLYAGLYAGPETRRIIQVQDVAIHGSPQG